MSYLLPPAKVTQISDSNKKRGFQLASIYNIIVPFRFILQNDQEEQYRSPGIGHSGIGASAPILIVISLGRMRFFNLPI